MSEPGKRSPAAQGDDVVRVVIVGGGCGGLSTAWQLTRLNVERDRTLARIESLEKDRRGDAAEKLRKTLSPRYEITVYEARWCLGGKGASTRDSHGRILEHGLHVWLGFYENAFRMMRECYDEAEGLAWGPWQPGKGFLPHARFEDAFTAEPHIGVACRHRGDLQAWTAFLPPMKGEPGTPLDAGTNPFSAWGYLARALALAKSLMQSVLAPSRAEPDARQRSAVDEAVELNFAYDPRESPEVVIERLSGMARVVMLTSAAGLMQAATFLESWLRERNPAPRVFSALLKVIEALATNTRRQLEDVVLVDESLRRKTEILDLLMTILIGLYRDRVFFDERGLDVIDGIDYRDWLENHGATRGAVNSPLVAGIYDLVFAYRGGDHRKPALSAAQALRGAMRMFLSYRGSMFWRMRSGMGDAVFAPLYRVLERRGVRFMFLHRLHSIQFDFRGTGDHRLQALQFRTPGDSALPERVNALDERGCWPDSPEKRFKVGPWPPQRWFDGPPLQAGQDFDAAVLALGLDDLVRLCAAAPNPVTGSLGEADFQKSAFFRQLPDWNRMRKSVATVGTRAAQVWLSKSLEDLGWGRGPVVLAGIDAMLIDRRKQPRRRKQPARRKQPMRLFETWADMTHTLAAERAFHGAATPAGRAHSVAYFCGVLPDPPDGNSSPVRVDDKEEALADFLAERMRFAWPQAYADDRTPLDWLVSADGQRIGAGYLGEQHIVDNRVGSDRYTQSLPGSGTCRISPLDPGFANMTVAGDWTDCGFNGGCVEAAVMSGMLAAHAISGRLDLNEIVGYHHP